jgi:hypothetical protein
LLRAQEDHVVVRGDDDLVGLARVIEYDVIAGPARGCVVALVADMACSDTELPECTGDTPGEQFVEEQPDSRSPRRGATS